MIHMEIIMDDNKGAVIRLQEMALDSSIEITETLRYALLIATKLGLTDLKQWVSRELKGYNNVNDKEIPEYRILKTEIKYKNPFHGLCPVIFDEAKEAQELMHALTKHYAIEPISSLANLLDSGGNTIQITIPNQLQYLINKCYGINVEFFRTASKSQIQGLIDRVRTNLLEFALTLEENGILGIGVSFSKKEKQKAVIMGNQININNSGVFQNTIGNMNNIESSQTLNNSVIHNDFESLKNFLLSNKVDAQDIDALSKAIEEDSNITSTGNNFGKNVTAWIDIMIVKAVNGVWNIGTNVASELLTESLRRYFGLS